MGFKSCNNIFFFGQWNLFFKVFLGKTFESVSQQQNKSCGHIFQWCFLWKGPQLCVAVAMLQTVSDSKSTLAKIVKKVPSGCLLLSSAWCLSQWWLDTLTEWVWYRWNCPRAFKILCQKIDKDFCLVRIIEPWKYNTFLRRPFICYSKVNQTLSLHSLAVVTWQWGQQWRIIYSRLISSGSAWATS